MECETRRNMRLGKVCGLVARTNGRKDSIGIGVVAAFESATAGDHLRRFTGTWARDRHEGTHLTGSTTMATTRRETAAGRRAKSKPTTAVNTGGHSDSRSLIGTSKASGLLGLSRGRVKQLAKAGTIGRFEPSLGIWLFSAEELERFKRLPKRGPGNPDFGPGFHLRKGKRRKGV
jgi:hypothetical protein